MTSTTYPIRPPQARSPRPTGLAARWDAIGRPPRIVGLDLARALAIIGMIGAHVGVTVTASGGADIAWSDPSTWNAVVMGRPSILFALLAGISVVLATGGPRIPAGNDIARARLSLAGRGVAIFAVGVVLEMMGTSVAVILSFWGALFVLAGFFVTWTARRLLATGAVLALVGPLVVAGLASLSLEASGPGVDLVLGVYPLHVWLSLLLIGMGLARLDLRQRSMAPRLVAAGLVLAVVGYGIGHLASSGALGEAIERNTNPAAMAAAAPPKLAESAGYIERLTTNYPVERILAHPFNDAPHSGGTAEIIGSGGFALVVLGLCLLIGRVGRRVLTPMTAMGSMPLTAYAAHIIVILIWMGGPMGTGLQTSSGRWIGLSLAIMAGCTAWALIGGRGPLERLVSRSARAFAAPATPTNAGSDSQHSPMTAG